MTTDKTDRMTRVDTNGALYMPALQIVLYADADPRAGAVACYRLFVERFGGDVRWYHARSMRKVRPFVGDAHEIFPTLCADEDGRLPAFRVAAGAGLQDYRPPIFSTGAYARFSWLQILLPTTVARDWAALETLIAAMAATFAFRYGTAGLCLCWNEVSVDRDIQVSALIGPLLKRHPGFNLGTPRELCDQPVPPVNWVTLLGPALLKQLGGTAALRGALGDDDEIVVRPLGHGVLVRAGDVPRAGDRNRRDDLPLYRKVGALLKDLRGSQDIELDGLTLAESEAWLARFDA